MSAEEMTYMGFMDNIVLALESLKMNKIRAILTMLGIIIGIGSVIAISTVGSSLSGSVSSSMSSLGASSITVSLTQKSDDGESGVRIAKFMSQDPDEKDLITDEMLEEYKKTFPDNIRYIKLSESVGTGTVTNTSDASSQTSVNIIGVNDDYDEAEELNVMYGRYINNKKDGVRKVCVVSDKFVEDTLSILPAEVIGEKIKVNINSKPYEFYIEGVYEYEEETATSSDNKNTDIVTDMYFPMETAKLITKGKEGYSSFTVVTSADTSTEEFMNTTGDYFESFYNMNDTWTCEATSLETMVSALTDMLGTISFAIAAIAAISLIVGGIGVMNIMLVSIMERTKEIGTRKALGASNNSIRMQFITEAIVICVIGGIMGVLIGVGAGAIISNALGYPTRPSVFSIVMAVIFSVAVGIIFGYAPANKAARLNPIDALRYE